MIRGMDLVYSLFQTEALMRDNLNLINLMVKEFINELMETYMKESFKMI
jgi:hypothetical protein